MPILPEAVNCCRCMDGVYLKTEQYVQCFNCGHVLNTCCPAAYVPKASRIPMSSFETSTDSSSSNASTSSSGHCSHGGYPTSHYYTQC